MIAKIVPGKNFKGALDYITDIYGKDKQKKGARIICHSTGIPPNADNRLMAQCLDAYAHKGNHNLKDPVRHFMLSFSRYDAPKLTDDLMSRILCEFLSRMGYKNAEFVAARHQSVKNPHLHCITLRIDKEGKTISDSMEREKAQRIALELTKKYGLYISSGKVNVSRDRLHGMDKAKYNIYDILCEAREHTDNWLEFESYLDERGVSMKFHVNNVTGKLLGVSFSDGKYSFSGRQIDRSMTLSNLSEQYGDIREIVHESVHEYYDRAREEYLRRAPNNKYFTLLRTLPTFDDLYPKGVPDIHLSSVKDAVDNIDYNELVRDGHIISSKDGKSEFMPLAILCAIILPPYQPQISMGGGSGPGTGWRDKKDDDDEKWKFRVNVCMLQNKMRGKGKKPVKRKK